jgi:hypothetical protein
MNRFFAWVLAAVKRGKRRPGSRRPGGRLGVEAMEQRVVPSASPLAKLPAELGATALVSKSSGHEISTLEQPVHGYKWRRPRPYDAKTTSVSAEPGLWKTRETITSAADSLLGAGQKVRTIETPPPTKSTSAAAKKIEIIGHPAAAKSTKVADALAGAAKSGTKISTLKK